MGLIYWTHDRLEATKKKTIWLNIDILIHFFVFLQSGINGKYFGDSLPCQINIVSHIFLMWLMLKYFN